MNVLDEADRICALAREHRDDYTDPEYAEFFTYQLVSLAPAPEAAQIAFQSAQRRADTYHRPVTLLDSFDRVLAVLEPSPDGKIYL